MEGTGKSSKLKVFAHGVVATSVFPMTESGPGLGGPNTQKSVIELTCLGYSVTLVGVDEN